MSDNTYDVAVVGAGVFGAWTAYQLQRSRKRVVLIDAYGAGTEDIVPVEDLAQLPRSDPKCEAVRFQIELELFVGATWDPPRVDSVVLNWYERATGGARR